MMGFTMGNQERARERETPTALRLRPSTFHGTVAVAFDVAVTYLRGLARRVLTAGAQDVSRNRRGADSGAGRSFTKKEIDNETMM
jgi:hypothetical protein